MFEGASIGRTGLQDMLQHRGLVASSLALIVHLVGLVGMVFIDLDWFASMTPINLLLMSLLLIWTQGPRGIRFYTFMAIAFLTGMITEMIGVNSGLLFGNYAYGDIMGAKLMGVPFIIGMNWFVVMLGAAATMTWISRKFFRMDLSLTASPMRKMFSEGILWIGAGLLAVLFDWVMEPAAIRLGFWAWAGEGDVPLFNYVCWFFVSMFLLQVMRLLKISTSNPFAIHLFLIQLAFFILIRVLV
jgi:putative membrane protein